VYFGGGKYGQKIENSIYIGEINWKDFFLKAWLLWLAMIYFVPENFLTDVKCNPQKKKLI
jgi:hypothetical protein